MKVWLVTTLFLLVAGSANALEVPPMSGEEILCLKETALVVEVVDARSHDCGHPRDGCYSHYLGVTLRIREILPSAVSGLHVGDEINAGLRVGDGTQAQVGDQLAENMVKNGILGFPATDQPITDAAARTELGPIHIQDSQV
jgi:hypothetical protein